MAADVLTYNALQEINQELKAESALLTVGISSASSGGGGGGQASADPNVLSSLKYSGSPNMGLQCMIPRNPASGSWTGGVKVCDTTSYRRCGCCCNWTVPGGVTCARFQIWGAGGGNGTSCCCGGNSNGGSGAYASVIMPVTAGSQYTLCAGCAYCCFTERAQMTQDGCPSWVTGPGLTNFCAEGGETNLFCESKSRCLHTVNSTGWCIYMGWCICNTGTDFCVDNPDIAGTAYPDGRRDMSYQATANCKTHFGEATSGDVYGMPGQWSYYAYDFGANNGCHKHPGIVGFKDCSCCEATMNNENSGCCYQACYCNGMCCIPGAGAWGYSTCGGDTNGCADIGKTGMVCVSYK